MKTAVYFSKQDLRVIDWEENSLGDNEVRISVKYCGVCGTDIHIYEGDGGAFAVSPPRIIGHEFSGIVEKIGKNVRNVSVEDRVSVDPNNMCGSCYFCRNGKAHFCTNNIGYGTTHNGGFAEYCNVDSKQVFKIPEHLSLQSASLVETISCCINGIDRCNIRVGQTVLVIGAGTIGLIMLQLAKSCGSGKVIVTDIVPEKLKMAKKLGADVAFNSLQDDIATLLKAECYNVDCVIECAGTICTVEQSVELAGKGATVMLFGLVSPDDIAKIKPSVIFSKELNVTSSLDLF